MSAALSVSVGTCWAAEVFVDATTRSGLEFQHFNGMSGELYFPEMMGGGVALFDYDGDGDLDVYLVQGHMLGGKPVAEATFPPAHPVPLTDRLYRNDLEDGRVTFKDVTESAGIRAEGYGMGVAAGDYDNDGHVDLYVTNFGANELWRNRGDGTFEDVTGKAGVGDPNWSVSASWLDYDRDGWLDLYVGNYVDYSFDNPKPCRSSTSARDYCSPLVYQPQVDSLFRNRGDGTFEDVSESTGIRRAYGGALGVVAADFNGDRWPDIYVANDGVANQLWINDGKGRFDNDAVMAGVAFNMDGSPEASMGVDAGDFDGDGDEDLFMTHLTRETNTLYINDGRGWFEDRTVAMGLANPSFAYTGFGTAWIDYDRDGWLDLLVVNGAVTRVEAQLMAGDPYPLKQPDQLFRNLGDGRYTEVTAQAGTAFKASLVSRGAAFGDLDQDGDPDVVIGNNAGPARVLINVLQGDAGWIGLRLVTREGRRDAYGARVALEADRPLWRRVRADGSYASSNDSRVLFGLGPKAPAELAVRVIWPNGVEERFAGLATGRYHQLRQGGGSESPP
ncbi:MAG: hypothetical protein AMJ59_08500 [Gammaproteobacteria bacterium SG8_31]|nr:MAG: hypothetical protein AMJ59_08500 [Gammaproteobacteria bacterium SG8_31]